MSSDDDGAWCPIPGRQYDRVVLGHGGGGLLSDELLRDVFLRAFRGDTLAKLEDSAVLPRLAGRLAFTTDAFVVHPLFFPGGDIGRLAVAGTVNDLAVAGAKPLYLSAAFILEEGLLLTDLERIVESMRSTAQEAGVELVAGDTKVVERGKADGAFVVTTGIGVVPEGRTLSVSAAEEGNAVLVSGTLGDHGVAVLARREGLEFETTLESDCAPLASLVDALLERAPSTRALRDPTRGGLASSLVEIAAASRVSIAIDEAQLPLRPEVRAACELFGLDVLHIANEGKLVAIVPESEADAALAAMHAHPLGRNAARIGKVAAERAGQVTLRTSIGAVRVVTQLSGEQLPRIC
ncbi:MAG: hydrogenase expression/formation protein HypE [Polyangiaceae bacterium]|nr:hydrogenase expression/formation protein HypE [Polyangiaceae bacterium]